MKPLFYTKIDETLVFSSEIKALFQYPGVKKVLNEQSISELFGIGPAHTSGTTVFKNIYEIKPAHFGIFNKNGFNIKRYWKLKSEKHVDTFEETCEKLKFLLNDAIISLIINIVTLIVSFKIFNIDKKSIRLFIFFISILMTIIILENNYLISYYNQSTLDPVWYNWILILIHMILMPFSDIFTVMYKIKMFKLAIIIIPIFILFSYIVYRKASVKKIK